ncbi:hypothetical protein KIW84_035642 [Lathyrus oleraceus]|uniref:Uncharacterized protein n=1 Tax=Pisum sativum TaxID=3888 RepID=A0A9D4Y2P6_PEA|nr:hypothetical protein KIW84_035642 [Pisum sativum]
MTVKFSIVNRIGVANWAPTNHNSGITTSLTKLTYQIGIMVEFDFGEYVFAQVFNQLESYDMKLPIGFHALIFGILISQRHDNINSEDLVGVRLKDAIETLIKMRQLAEYMKIEKRNREDSPKGKYSLKTSYVGTSGESNEANKDKRSDIAAINRGAPRVNLPSKGTMK